MTASKIFEGSNSILIVGGSNVAWPAEVADFQRPRAVNYSPLPVERVVMI